MTRIRWIAGRDGVAHARRPGSARSLCGLPAIDERLAWPERTACPLCVRLAVPLTLDALAAGPASRYAIALPDGPKDAA